MSEDEKTPNINAENNSIAVGGVSIGGDVSGNIHIGHTTGSTQKEVSVILEQISSTFQPKPFDGRCAYKGLDHFKEKDAELFFGGERVRRGQYLLQVHRKAESHLWCGRDSSTL